MAQKFTRSSTGLYPIIHHTFHAKDTTGDGQVEYYIQDLTEDKAEEAVELYAKFYTPDESVQIAAKIPENSAAVEKLKKYNHSLIKEKLSLACYKMGSHELVGLNLITAKTRGSPDIMESADANLALLIKIVDFTESKIDIHAHYNVDHYLNGIGLCVNPNYRGRGIATEMLKARKSLLTSVGLTVSATSFSGIASQKSALKAGFEEISAVSFKDIQAQFPDSDFSSASASHVKTMALKI